MEKVSRFTGVYRYVSSTRRYNGRPDECYYYTIKAESKKKRVKVGWVSEGITASYAAHLRAEAITAVRNGEAAATVAPPPLRLSEAWELYYNNHCLTNTKSPRKTLSRWHSLIEERLGHLALDEITPLRLEEFKAELMATGRSPKTIEHALNLIRRIYRKMESWDRYDGKIPTDKVTWPEYDNRRDRWLTTDEARRLMGEIRGRSEMFWRICMVALYTGMRYGEIAALRGEHINLSAGTIRVTDTKGGTNRTVFITGELRDVLKETARRPGRLVFPARDGEQSVEPSDTFRRAVDALHLNHGIRDRRHRVVFHSLRHTFGSWLAMAGVPLYWIAALMGHTNEEVTERYAHLCPGVQRQAVDCIDSYFHAEALIPGLWFSQSGRQNTDPGPGADTERAGRP